MSYYKKIAGDKVYLSPIDPGDYEKFTEWLNDLDVTLHLTLSPLIINAEKEKEMLEKMSREGYHFAIVTKETDELIGTCGLLNANQLHRTAETGIFIGNSDYWNRGYGKEAIELLLDYGFNLLNLNSIYIAALSYNQRAIQCYKKCGFKEIGRRREAYIAGKKHYDIVLMDILASEFNGKIPGYIDKLQEK